jgi:PKD repeat protein
MKTIFTYLEGTVLALVTMAGTTLMVQSAAAQTWSTNSPLQAARWAHTATLLTNGSVLIAGGMIYNIYPDSADTNACELYDPASGTSTLTEPMQVSRNSHTATLLTNGQVLVAGGGSGATSEVYDPISSTWINLASMNDHRRYHTATLLLNGQVLVAAGYNDNNGLELSSAEVYDVGSQTWTSTGLMPYGTDSQAAVLLTNGMVLVCGGSDGNGYGVTNAALYNPASHTWTSTAGMNEPRAGNSATLLPDGTVLVAGGGDNTAEIYDPVAATWTLVAPMNDGRQYPQAVLLNDGKVMVLGGDPNNTDVEMYDERNDQWFYTASLPVPGNSQTATLLANGRVVVTGGDASDYSGPALDTVQTFTANSETGHTLIAHYPFDTSSTNPLDPQFLADTSGNGYNLSSSSTACSVTTNRIAGSSAVQFPGSDYFELPKVLLTTISGTYSLSLWLDTTQVAGSDTADGPSSPGIVWAGGTSDNYNDSEPMTLTGSKLGFYTGDDQSTLHSFTSINTGSFTHIVITRDQPTGVKKIYINGVLDATETGDTNFLADSDSLELGASYYSGAIVGIVDDVQFYNGLLTSGEVASLHANPGTTVPDSSGSTPTPSLAVTASPATGVSPLTVQFSSSSMDSDGNTVTSWHWNFGDGGTSTAQNPNYTYNSVGNYSPSLTAYSTFGATPLSISGLGVISVTNSPGMWTLTDSLTNAVRNQTATLLPNGKVLLVGGYNYSVNAFAAAELYDPAAGTWTSTQPLNLARSYHTATLLNNGLVLVAGGATNANGGTGATTSAELYNPTNGTWTLTGSMHTPRYTHTATLLPSGKVLVAGGQSTNAYPNIIASAELYDPATGQWTTVNPMATQRYSHTATLLPNGKVLVAGGGVTNSLLVTGACELYDPTDGSWSSTGYMTYPLVNHTATLLPDGTVLVAGGDFDEGGFGGVSLIPSFFAMLYDPAAGTWSSTANMFSVRDYHTATLLHNGLVLVAGDEVYGVNPTNSAELYIPSSKTWVRAAAMNAPRQFHTATLLNNGQVMAAGGVGNSGVLASAELFNPASTPAIILFNPQSSGANFQFQFLSQSGFSHNILYRTNLVIGNWLTNSTVIGDGTVKIISIPYSLFNPAKQGFIRVSTQ